MINSAQQLAHVINEKAALLTIRRGGQTFIRRAPRVKAEELKWDSEFKEELIDWQFEAGLNNEKIQSLFVIPYNLTSTGEIEARVEFIDKENEEEAFPSAPFSHLDSPLKIGDQIIAVNGVAVSLSYEILFQLQKQVTNIIVQRDPQLQEVIDSKEADQRFDQQFKEQDLQRIVSTIGTKAPVKQVGNLVLLRPIEPKKRGDFKLEPKNQALLAKEIEAQKKAIESITDPEKKAQAKQLFSQFNDQLVLGLPAIQDVQVNFNPNPVSLFTQVFEEIWTTLSALFTGSLSPKWLSGPIGIVQVVHDNSMVSIKEALFWLGAISLNLGVLNLLPLPVLDGGTICFSLYELITGRRIQAKTMEKLIIPFALLLIGFFVFLTYHDLSRLFKNFF